MDVNFTQVSDGTRLFVNEGTLKLTKRCMGRRGHYSKLGIIFYCPGPGGGIRGKGQLPSPSTSIRKMRGSSSQKSSN